MVDDKFSVDLVKEGALLRFEDGMYGVMLGDHIEYKDRHTLLVDGYEVSVTIVRYMNEKREHMDDKYEDVEEDIMTGIGDALRELRNEQGMKQADFENVSGFTMSVTENHKQLPRISTIEKMCQDMEISIGKFLSRATVRFLEARDDGS